MLDRSIVAAAATDPSARAVLMAMATFARQTGAYVIAEGIEDEDTLAFLRTIDDRDDRCSAGRRRGRRAPSPGTCGRSPARTSRRSSSRHDPAPEPVLGRR